MRDAMADGGHGGEYYFGPASKSMKERSHSAGESVGDGG
jgi:hypothetical protein